MISGGMLDSRPLVLSLPQEAVVLEDGTGTGQPPSRGVKYTQWVLERQGTGDGCACAVRNSSRGGSLTLCV
jgi:hypothetical protein